MDLKIRDRTDDELLVRKKEFLTICDVLDETKINYFLQTGILLGAIRDNDLIKWDWDVEISVFSNEFLPKIDLIVNKLINKNFEIKNVNKKKYESKIDFIGEYPEDVTGYTIFSWNYSKSEDKYWRKNLTVPSKFLNKLSSTNLFGREFKCPNYTEEYLAFAYGDWKTPLRSANKELYMTKHFRNKFKSLIIDLKNNSLKFLYRLWQLIKK